MPASIAPALGRLTAPARHGSFEEVRLTLVDTLVSAHAKAPLDGGVWLAAWQRAMETVRDQLMSEASAAIDRAAVRARFPAARLAEARPGTEVAETLLHRLLAEGEPLERLDGAANDEAATRARGAILQAVWEAAMRIATSERGHWTGVATDIEQWRRPWRPLVIAGACSIVVVGVLAAMLGGVIPAPTWFQPVTDWFWGLPWP